MNKMPKPIIALIYLVIIFLTASVINSEPITIVAVGDIMLANRYTPYLKKYGYTFPFKYTRDITSTADIAIGNLEAPISLHRKNKRKKRFTFLQNPKIIQSLQYAGFDVLNLANNHTLDFGVKAFNDTIKILNDNNIIYIGGGHNRQEAEDMKIVRIKGITIGFLGFNKTLPWSYYAGKNRPGTAYASGKIVKKIILKNRDKVDILIVSFHWGKEYRWKPKSYQISLARQSINNGANIVLGHHPHCIQPIEKYKNGIIAYSLGNFAFGSYGRPPKRKADKSLILKLYIQNKKLIKAEIIPLDVYNYRIRFQSRIPDSPQLQKKILNYIKKISKRFNTTIDIVNNRGWIYWK